jgi:hypothetical protein
MGDPKRPEYGCGIKRVAEVGSRVTLFIIRAATRGREHGPIVRGGGGSDQYWRPTEETQERLASWTKYNYSLPFCLSSDRKVETRNDSAWENSKDFDWRLELQPLQLIRVARLSRSVGVSIKTVPSEPTDRCSCDRDCDCIRGNHHAVAHEAIVAQLHTRPLSHNQQLGRVQKTSSILFVTSVRVNADICETKIRDIVALERVGGQQVKTQSQPQKNGRVRHKESVANRLFHPGSMLSSVPCS